MDSSAGRTGCRETLERRCCCLFSNSELRRLVAGIAARPWCAQAAPSAGQLGVPPAGSGRSINERAAGAVGRAQVALQVGQPGLQEAHQGGRICRRSPRRRLPCWLRQSRQSSWSRRPDRSPVVRRPARADAGRDPDGAIASRLAHLQGCCRCLANLSCSPPCCLALVLAAALVLVAAVLVLAAALLVVVLGVAATA